MITGSGVGGLLVESVEEVFKHCDVNVDFEKFPVVDAEDSKLVERIAENDAIMRGPANEGINPSSDVYLPQKLDMYAYIVHAFNIPGVGARHENVDIVIIRENSEGEYSTIEHEIFPGFIESIKVVTKEKSLRIAEYAFEYATISNRKKVTVVHKANIIKKSDGDFLNAAREISEKYPRIKLEEMIVDAACMNLIIHPEIFDIILVPNLYGSIIGNVGTGLVGGAGITPGANIGRSISMFEQGARCAATSLVKDKAANPSAFILSACMMLRHLNQPYYADLIQAGVFRTLRKGKVRTPDLGGTHTTQEFTLEVLRNIK